MWLALSLLTASGAPVKIVAAEASPASPDGGSPADHVRDGKSATAWSAGDGGQVELDLGGTKTVTRLQLLAGDWSSGSAWTRASRPKELEIRWADGSTALWTLDDTFRIQAFVPDSPKSTATIRLVVKSVYAGSVAETAIAEILVFDDAPATTAPIGRVAASSERVADAEGGYSASAVADGIRDTWWCEGNATTDGTGDTVLFTFDAPTRVSAVSICNGMCASADALKKGNTPSRVTLTFSDGSSQGIDLKALMPLSQKVAITPVTTASVELRIDAVRKGSELDDACLSEVEFHR